MALPRTVAQHVPLVHFDSNTLTGNYQPINPQGLDHSCFYVRIVNDSAHAITISQDGITDGVYLLAADAWELNAQQNAQLQSGMCQFKQGQIFYVTGTASVGTITLTGYYV